MATHILKSDTLTLQIASSGAELISIRDSRMNTEYLWNGDPVYWKRHAPILFPFVGGLKNKSYQYDGKVYPMSQHGFARDMEFDLLHETKNEIWFALSSTEETYAKYPFHFRLELGYRLTERTITVMWKVMNQDEKTMYFSIGGHPAFFCPLKEGEKQSDYYLHFDTDQPLHYLLIDDAGMAVKKPYEEQNLLKTNQGFLPIGPHLFDQDALIIEENQCHEVSLWTPSKKLYLTVSFDAPLFGLWSPAGKNAPFICIEPWYGRCDSSDFTGSLEEREWGNQLEPGQPFEASYSIKIEEIS
jgi:galactose mutarotase-like enzyme